MNPIQTHTDSPLSVYENNKNWNVLVELEELSNENQRVSFGNL